MYEISYKGQIFSKSENVIREKTTQLYWLQSLLSPFTNGTVTILLQEITTKRKKKNKRFALQMHYPTFSGTRISPTKLYVQKINNAVYQNISMYFLLIVSLIKDQIFFSPLIRSNTFYQKAIPFFLKRPFFNKDEGKESKTCTVQLLA